MPNDTAKSTEILAFLTRVMRREETDTTLVRTENGLEQIELPVRASDAMRAAELLGRREGLFKESMRAEIVMPEVEDDI